MRIYPQHDLLDFLRRTNDRTEEPFSQGERPYSKCHVLCLEIQCYT